MIKRSCVALLAALLLVPGAAAAQFRERMPPPRLSITPMLGYRFGYTTTVEGTLFTLDEAVSAEFRERRGGGPVLGGEVELRVVGPLSLIGGVGFAESADNYVASPGQPEERFVGPRVWFYSAGLSLRLPEPAPDFRRYPLVASISVAPAIVREEQRRNRLPENHPLYVPNPWSSINHPAVNVGAKAGVRLGTPRIAFQFGVNDFVTFWNAAEVERQLEGAYREQLGLDVIADYEMGMSHLFQGHAGLSIRF